MGNEQKTEFLEQLGEYKYGFRDPETFTYKAEKGLNRTVVEKISEMKGEPQWMLDFRLRALEHFVQRPIPTWGADLSVLNLDDIYFYVQPNDGHMAGTWDEVPDTIKRTFDRLGIPEAERKFLAGVGAQYESEVIYHSIKESLSKQGVIFLGMDQ